MIRKTAAILMLCASIGVPACKKKTVNEVPLEQITADRANDYRYIFRDLLAEQKSREERHKKDPFRE
jgi:hypothetical protein